MPLKPESFKEPLKYGLKVSLPATWGMLKTYGAAYAGVLAGIAAYGGITDGASGAIAGVNHCMAMVHSLAPAVAGAAVGGVVAGCTAAVRSRQRTIGRISEILRDHGLVDVVSTAMDRDQNRKTSRAHEISHDTVRGETAAAKGRWNLPEHRQEIDQGELGDDRFEDQFDPSVRR